VDLQRQTEEEPCVSEHIQKEWDGILSLNVFLSPFCKKVIKMRER
jgi:hypothetical protein